MEIGRNYKVESDSLNVILSHREKNKKSGEYYWRAIGFFATIQGALKSLVDKEVRETLLKDLDTVSKKQDELYGLIGKLDPHSSVRKGLCRGQEKLK